MQDTAPLFTSPPSSPGIPNPMGAFFPDPHMAAFIQPHQLGHAGAPAVPPGTSPFSAMNPNAAGLPADRGGSMGAIVDDYVLGAEICEGSYGVVRQATLKNPKNEEEAHKLFAIKVVKKERFCDSEISLQQQVISENVLKILKAFTKNELVYIVLEFCGGGDLFEHVNQMVAYMDEPSVLKYFMQMLRAVQALHEQNISHHDVKLENFLLSTDFKTVKLCDFGAAEKLAHEGATSRYKGEVSAPEKKKGNTYNGFLADIYQLGKSLHELAFGLRQPKNYSQLNPPPNFCPSPALLDLLAKLLADDPAARPSLISVSRHIWLNGGHAPPHTHLWYKVPLNMPSDAPLPGYPGQPNQFHQHLGQPGGFGQPQQQHNPYANMYQHAHAHMYGMNPYGLPQFQQQQQQQQQQHSHPQPNLAAPDQGQTLGSSNDENKQGERVPQRANFGDTGHHSSPIGQYGQPGQYNPTPNSLHSAHHPPSFLSPPMSGMNPTGENRSVWPPTSSVMTKTVHDEPITASDTLASRGPLIAGTLPQESGTVSSNTVTSQRGQQGPLMGGGSITPLGPINSMSATATKNGTVDKSQETPEERKERHRRERERKEQRRKEREERRKARGEDPEGGERRHKHKHKHHKKRDKERTGEQIGDRPTMSKEERRIKHHKHHKHKHGRNDTKFKPSDPTSTSTLRSSNLNNIEAQQLAISSNVFAPPPQIFAPPPPSALSDNSSFSGLVPPSPPPPHQQSEPPLPPPHLTNGYHGNLPPPPNAQLHQHHPHPFNLDNMFPQQQTSSVPGGPAGLAPLNSQFNRPFISGQNGGGTSSNYSSDYESRVRGAISSNQPITATSAAIPNGNRRYSNQFTPVLNTLPPAHPQSARPSVRPFSPQRSSSTSRQSSRSSSPASLHLGAPVSKDLPSQFVKDQQVMGSAVAPHPGRASRSNSSTSGPPSRRPSLGSGSRHSSATTPPPQPLQPLVGGGGGINTTAYTTTATMNPITPNLPGQPTHFQVTPTPAEPPTAPTQSTPPSHAHTRSLNAFSNNADNDLFMLNQHNRTSTTPYQQQPPPAFLHSGVPKLERVGGLTHDAVPPGYVGVGAQLGVTPLNTNLAGMGMGLTDAEIGLLENRAEHEMEKLAFLNSQQQQNHNIHQAPSLGAAVQGLPSPRGTVPQQRPMVFGQPVGSPTTAETPHSW